MIPDWVQLLATIVTPVIVVGLSAWLINSYFYSQRTWDLKVSQYSQTLIALSQIAISFEEYLEAERRHAPLSGDVQQGFDGSSQIGKRKIAELIYVGELIIQQEAIEALRNLKRELYRVRREERDFITFLCDSLDMIESTAQNISKIAKQDLLKSPPLGQSDGGG